MKLSERFKNSVACVVSLRELAESKEIDIPDVQRGLVWNPTQIANLWKSIFAGYPIGALTLYKQGENWQLIDGQQRWHAIKLGLLEPSIETAMTTLWVNADNLELMVCTRRHPWGFKWNQDESKLEKLPHDEMMKLWKEMMPQKMDSFAVPSMETASAYWAGKGMIPLYRILAGEIDDSVRQKTKEWRERVNVPSLPLIRFDLKQDDSREQNRQGMIEGDIFQDLKPGDSSRERNRIQELFTRINKGGTLISNTDLTYSTLCSYMGIVFKTNINTVAEGFLPPSRVARIYARLAHSIQEGGALREPGSAAYWSDKQCDIDTINAIINARKLLEIAAIPASIYLSSSGDDWLTVICWCMRKFPKLTGSDKDKKLLCMLPYVVCYESKYHAKFCNRFYEALKGLTSCDNLLTMLAIGVAYAACYSVETGMYPLGRVENPELKPEYSYDEEWLHIFGPHGNEALLHFLQTPYMNRLLCKECGFYPHEPATWGELMNRPWDDDHIVPQSRWWLLAQEEKSFRDSLANKQMLYYRRNREKHDSFAGVPADDNVCPARDFCYPCSVLLDKNKYKYYGWENVRLFAPRPAKLHASHRNYANQNNYPKFLGGYKALINRRLAEMVNRLWDELGIAQLVDTINAIPDMEEHVPACLKLAVECWGYLKDMPDAENLKWCAIRHDESRQQEIAVKDFYHSLCSWLAVGKEENGAFRCFCWQQVDARTLNIEGGLRRLPGLTQTEWMERAGEAPRSAWWVEDDKFKNGIYVSGEGDSSLKKEVEKVRPEDLFEIDHDMKVVYP